MIRVGLVVAALVAAAALPTAAGKKEKKPQPEVSSITEKNMQKLVLESDSFWVVRFAPEEHPEDPLLSWKEVGKALKQVVRVGLKREGVETPAVKGYFADKTDPVTYTGPNTLAGYSEWIYANINDAITSRS